MEGEQIVLYEVANRIARITLNRPVKRNALNDELIAGLKEALRRADCDEGSQVVVISGAGRDFCSGADLEALQKISTASVQDNLEDARSLMELYTLIRALRLPVIAAVKGRALAGGCGLALACDMVIADQSARFGFPEVKIGFVPAMVMAIARRNVSEKKAFELIALGGEVSASEAALWGLINHVFDADDFTRQTEVLAQRLVKMSASALALSKTLLYQMDGLSFVEAMESGVDVNVTARLSRECRDGITRFLGKDRSS